ncbi:MAG: hypothetical protein R2828_05330 [Saprospiraceae bacterium]
MATPIDGIMDNIILAQEKINRLERGLLLETDPASQFRIEHQIKEVKAKLEDLKVALKQQQAEAQQRTATPASPTNGKASLSETKERLEEQIALGEIDEVFKVLKELLKAKRQRNTLLQLMANYNMIRQQDLNGTASQEHIDLGYRRARHGLLSFIQDLEERHLEES